MRKCVIIIILLGITGILVGPARADIVNIDCGLWPEGHTFSWSFDYDLQKLTISQTLYYLEYDLDPDPWWSYGTSSLGVGGLADSDSTFSVELTITNETGIEWIGYELSQGPPPMIPAAYIIPGSIETTKLQTITQPYGPYSATWILSEPPAVFDGESFTISFDMLAEGVSYSHGSFVGGVRQAPVYVPEPATIMLFGIGGLALLKKHKQTFLPLYEAKMT